MGAFSLLSRKIGFAAAEKMILSGSLYTAEQLYDMGVVDILAEKGEGEVAVYRYIKSTRRNMNSYRAMQKVKDICKEIGMTREKYFEIEHHYSMGTFRERRWVPKIKNGTKGDVAIMHPNQAYRIAPALNIDRRSVRYFHRG